MFETAFLMQNKVFISLGYGISELYGISPGKKSHDAFWCTSPINNIIYLHIIIIIFIAIILSIAYNRCAAVTSRGPGRRVTGSPRRWWSSPPRSAPAAAAPGCSSGRLGLSWAPAAPAAGTHSTATIILTMQGWMCTAGLCMPFNIPFIIPRAL